MLLIYTTEKTERVIYTFDFIFRDILQIEFTLTDNKETFQGEYGPKMSYTNEPVDKELFFCAVSLLFDRGIRQIDVDIISHNNTIGLFPVERGAMPFDPFVGAFYLLSRYEEYLPFKPDEHHRFPPGKSIAVKNGFIGRPVIDEWAMTIKGILQQKFPNLEIGERKFKFIPTYDIDMAWAYLNKGLVRTIGGYMKSLFQFNFRDIGFRTATLLKMRRDPYFTFNFMKRLQKKYGFKPIYFFLLGDFDTYDKNISPQIPKFQKLIKDIADYAEIGIHPSYASNIDRFKLLKEKNTLYEISNWGITKSRQHYLMMQLPETYQKLVEIDIKDDYTMGYTQYAGFRSGTCTPHLFYNLKLDSRTQLTIHPFGFMDSVFQYYMKLKPDQVLAEARKIIDSVKKVEGTLYILWHNSSFSETFEWAGWRSPYIQILEYINNMENKNQD
jgi:Family of unknown function (DUF7033)